MRAGAARPRRLRLRQRLRRRGQDRQHEHSNDGERFHQFKPLRRLRLDLARLPARVITSLAALPSAHQQWIRVDARALRHRLGLHRDRRHGIAAERAWAVATSGIPKLSDTDGDPWHERRVARLSSCEAVISRQIRARCPATLSYKPAIADVARCQRVSIARLRIWGSGVRISSGAPLRYKTGHAKTRRFRA
jgi:hypothetical protein